MPTHALSVDVEDWNNLVVLNRTGRIVPPQPCVVRNTERMLELFQEHGARATWFMLGEVADAYPGLIRRLAEAGQELGVHGYHHHLVFNLTESAFRDGLRRAKDCLEQISGRVVLGYRAPAFSITPRVPWVLDVLAELGFVYDSSVYPFRGSRYGDPDAPLTRYDRPTRHGAIAEVPLTVVDCGRWRLPCCGGGYLRHFPLAYSRWAMRAVERRDRPAVFYLHPYEIDVEYDAEFLDRHLNPDERRGFGRVRWLQYRGRSRTEVKLRWLLEHYRFEGIARVFGLEPDAANSRGEAGRVISGQ